MDRSEIGIAGWTTVSCRYDDVDANCKREEILERNIYRGDVRRSDDDSQDCVSFVRAGNSYNSSSIHSPFWSNTVGRPKRAVDDAMRYSTVWHRTRNCDNWHERIRFYSTRTAAIVREHDGRTIRREVSMSFSSLPSDSEWCSRTSTCRSLMSTVDIHWDHRWRESERFRIAAHGSVWVIVCGTIEERQHESQSLYEWEYPEYLQRAILNRPSRIQWYSPSMLPNIRSLNLHTSSSIRRSTCSSL